MSDRVHDLLRHLCQLLLNGHCLKQYGAQSFASARHTSYNSIEVANFLKSLIVEAHIQAELSATLPFFPLLRKIVHFLDI